MLDVRRPSIHHVPVDQPTKPKAFCILPALEVVSMIRNLFRLHSIFRVLSSIEQAKSWVTKIRHAILVLSSLQLYTLAVCSGKLVILP